MTWTEWHPVSAILDSGWNVHDVPWKMGIYRFRVRADHPTRGTEVIYVGRAAGRTSTVCRRVGQFIGSAMGFYTIHSGGDHFYNESDRHVLSPRDLEFAWNLDDDPWCAEFEEYLSYRVVPVLNRKMPSTCGNAGCERARAISLQLSA